MKLQRISSGRRRIDWVYVDDVVCGFLRMTLAPDLDGKSVDLGSSTAVSIRDLVDQICVLWTRRSLRLMARCPIDQ